MVNKCLQCAQLRLNPLGVAALEGSLKEKSFLVANSAVPISCKDDASATGFVDLTTLGHPELEVPEFIGAGQLLVSRFTRLFNLLPLSLRRF